MHSPGIVEKNSADMCAWLPKMADLLNDCPRKTLGYPKVNEKLAELCNDRSEPAMRGADSRRAKSDMSC